jgi:IMP dehydrogenase/GMP reductase
MSIYNWELHGYLLEESRNNSKNSNHTKFDFDDITIVPETLSKINSRKDVNPFVEIDGKDYLPIMTSPMDTVVSLDNVHHFEDNKVLICLPRGSNIHSYYENVFPSISLEEAEELLKHDSEEIDSYYCIDMANGHMSRLYNLIRELYLNRPDVKLIIGNIANPNAYKMFAELSNVWGVRVGIGGGGACTTSANVAVHYPMGSLIAECYAIKQNQGYDAKIIADGGMRKYSDIIKALSLGADIVMIGSLFNKTLQSCSPTYLNKIIKVSGSLEKWLFKNKFSLYKKFRGMSTKEVQKEWGKKKLTTSEGVVKWNEVLYDLPKWINNLEDYLRSAMSYTSSSNLENFKHSEKVLISANAYRRFSK